MCLKVLIIKAKKKALYWRRVLLGCFASPIEIAEGSINK